jgi:mannose-6-phosphate isomerase-like protein (cupin superfamily)
MIEKVLNNSDLFAIIIRQEYEKDGISFFTEDSFSQQLGYMNRPKGYVIAPHRHNIVPREVIHTQEVLFIKSGKVRVDFYDDEQNYLESRILNKGDVILLAAGGHGFEMIEPSEMIEVKQGPYIGERDKVRFDHVEPHRVKLGNNE